MSNTPIRVIRARVELYNGAALAATYSYNDALKSIEVERVGEESKFFGFGVCQKVNIKLRDIERTIDIDTSNSFKIYFTSGAEDYVKCCPTFYVTEVNRDENTNELSITAYDALYFAQSKTLEEIDMEAPYTLRSFIERICGNMAASLITIGIDDGSFNLEFADGANLEGSETLREVLDDAAEATQSIYYINEEENIVFKRLDISGSAALVISKADYFTLNSKTNRRLATIVNATELGDNISSSTTIAGSTQYIRDNSFWTLREDIAELVEKAITSVGGLSINQFDCSWRGNYLLDIGDKIELVTKDNSSAFSYVINDKFSYNGGFSQQTSWSYAENENETESNPNTLGEALKQTFAKVDKANKQIDIVTSEIENTNANIASLQLNTDSISAIVTKMEEDNHTALEDMSENIATLTSKVDAQITAEDVTLAIQTELDNGVGKVVTNTGFTFNDEGLTVEKTNSEMKTTITEDGMTVYKNDEAVLTANNKGVTAIDLHAQTYLIVGSNSRFENYGDNRTGCFWIGGSF